MNGLFIGLNPVESPFLYTTVRVMRFFCLAADTSRTGGADDEVVLTLYK